MDLSVEEAFSLLLDSKSIMVSNDSDDDLMECSLDYILEEPNFSWDLRIYVLSDEQILEVYEYLEGKEKLALWD